MVRRRKNANVPSPLRAMKTAPKHEKIAHGDHSYTFNYHGKTFDTFVCDKYKSEKCFATAIRFNAPPFRIIARGTHTCQVIQGNVEAQLVRVSSTFHVSLLNNIFLGSHC